MLLDFVRELLRFYSNDKLKPFLREWEADLGYFSSIVFIFVFIFL